MPPGWQALRGLPLEEIAAYQWDRTNRIVLEDLQALPRERWIPVRYEQLLADPAKTMRRLCEFAGIQFDAALSERVAGALPPARYTHTPPDRTSGGAMRLRSREFCRRSMSTRQQAAGPLKRHRAGWLTAPSCARAGNVPGVLLCSTYAWSTTPDALESDRVQAYQDFSLRVR